MSSTPEARIKELNLTLPPAPKAIAVYKIALKLGNRLLISGHGPLKEDKTMITGRVGADLTLELGKPAARQVGLAILATVRDTLGSARQSGGGPAAGQGRLRWSTRPPNSRTIR